MKQKHVVCTVVLLFVCFVSIAHVFSEDEANPTRLVGLENSFRGVATKVYPSVVSIINVQLEREEGRIYYIPYRDPLFDGFFGDTFGGSRGSTGFQTPGREVRRVGIGSGVIIDPRGYIITNYHVLEKAFENKVTVKLADGREFIGIVKGSDPRFDIALVKIDGYEFPSAVLGNSDAVTIGDWALAIGNPYAFAFDDAQPTMTVGVISALNRTLPNWLGLDRAYHSLIQTDAAINMGNSGGPLVNIQGEVIGINVAIMSTTGGYQGLGFAIPSNLCNDIITEVIEGKEVLYSWLGVSVQNLTPELTDYFNFPFSEGVVVIKSLPDSPAKVAGIRDGDIITFFNDKKLKKVSDLLAQVNLSRAGDRVTLRVFRNEVEQDVDVIMGSRPREISRYENADALYWRGMRVDTISYEVARDLGLSSLNGVVITDIKPGSESESAGLKVGEIITEVNKKTIRTIDDYYASVYELNGDILIKTLRGYFVIKD